MADRKRGGAKYGPPSMDETKDHVLAAGREILLAAQGALRFCKTYVEATSGEQNRPHLVSFFQKAIAVADDLGKNILQVSPIQHAAEDISKTVMDFMEKEMSAKPEPRRAARPRNTGKTRKTSPKKKTVR